MSDSRSWLFVGETDNILAALLGHLSEDASRWGDRKPVGFSYEICSGTERSRRLNQLTREFKPLYHPSKQ